MAFSGVFVKASDSLRLVSWRGRTYAIANALQFLVDAIKIFVGWRMLQQGTIFAVAPISSCQYGIAESDSQGHVPAQVAERQDGNARHYRQASLPETAPDAHWSRSAAKIAEGNINALAVHAASESLHRDIRAHYLINRSDTFSRIKRTLGRWLLQGLDALDNVASVFDEFIKNLVQIKPNRSFPRNFTKKLHGSYWVLRTWLQHSEVTHVGTSKVRETRHQSA